MQEIPEMAQAKLEFELSLETFLIKSTIVPFTN